MRPSWLLIALINVFCISATGALIAVCIIGRLWLPLVVNLLCLVLWARSVYRDLHRENLNGQLEGLNGATKGVDWEPVNWKFRDEEERAKKTKGNADEPTA